MTAAMTTACPRCGADAPPTRSRCGECGFQFVAASERPRLPSPSPAAIVTGLAIAAAAVALVAVVGRDETPAPPAPVAPKQAEPRIRSMLGLAADGSQGAVRCPGALTMAHYTRCGVIYPNGDTQLLPVRLTQSGDFNVEVPYPAMRR